jgi:5'-nucleotidase
MRILVCNDDGIEAPGIALLGKAALVLGPDIWVVAPERKWTAASHQLSFDRDLTLTRKGERSFVCSGAPADCVVAAMTVLFASEPKPDLVLAGVNDKRNVAEDIAYSGTMAIGREATFWGVPAIALSQVNGVSHSAVELATLRRLLQVLWETRHDWAANGHWLSVNLPATLPAPVSQAVIGRDKIASACDVGERTPQRITYRIRRERPGTSMAGDENAHIDAGDITVVRHRWAADAPVAESVVATWSDALIPPDGRNC